MYNFTRSQENKNKTTLIRIIKKKKTILNVGENVE